MKIEMAKHSGFCMGVKNAILKIVDELNASDDEILVYGPLIHNPQTIDVLKQRGLVTINSLDEITKRQIAIRTHGIPVEENRKIREEASRTINLTCSRVARVQSIIKKYSKSGYYTIIIGDHDHAEVIGLKSYAASGVTVVSDKNDISRIPPGKKYIVVSQTTHERREFDKLVEAISRIFQDALIIDTICDSTRLRQDDVTEGISKGIDTLVVVGGKNSANTTRLAKIGTDNGIRTVHIETEEELNPGDFEKSNYILVTAGASTPGWIINNVLEKLYAIKNSRSSFPLRILRQCFEFLVRSSIISSFSSFFMSLIALKYADLFPDLRYGTIAFFYIFVMYSVNNYLDKNFLVKNNSYKYRIYKQYGKILLFVSIIFF
ncbi:MAG TPA: 4-hydroxy-3-methylbut-2-enyl diphosphate reductase, partial [Spirochaetota bacterium]|nr:4-hydroxy-3-methylbut-2-enyl diphosphate reductase [Spirochaetota bacterium]